MYLIPCENLFNQTFASLWEQKDVASGVLYAALVKWSLKGTMDTPSKASFSPVFLNKNTGLGWVSVKASIVLIKMLQEVGVFSNKCWFPRGRLACAVLLPAHPGQRDASSLTLLNDSLVLAQPRFPVDNAV